MTLQAFKPEQSPAFEVTFQAGLQIRNPSRAELMDRISPAFDRRTRNKQHAKMATDYLLHFEGDDFTAMTVLRLPRHPGLFATTRLRMLTSEPLLAPLADWLLLFSFGAIAAFCSTCLDLQIQRVPGHAILRVVFPIAMGLALVPRSGAGTVMGASALFTAALLRMSNIHSEGLSFGAMTSLLATGPLLDMALRHVKGGWKQYAAFAIAGLSSNLLALLVRGTAKWTGFELPGRRPFGEWLMQASVTYVVCGLVAGLIGGIVLFCARGPSGGSSPEHSS